MARLLNKSSYFIGEDTGESSHLIVDVSGVDGRII